MQGFEQPVHACLPAQLRQQTWSLQDDQRCNGHVQVTGAVGWRKDNLRYKKNEVFLDIIEQVNMLMSNKGSVLRCDVNGKVVMKVFLSGMPDVKLGLNDALEVRLHLLCMRLRASSMCHPVLGRRPCSARLVGLCPSIDTSV